ncbi:uncharacterized protein HMPREF1541_08822 [Cyphellophora europaea CBS 101466]|uniref:FAD-binding PCMH-type domain-containing protein n=1 Tax=Cyphellophora europaea (strain CBS 101466) TaxID=1220924 RepID=W2RLD9_CYPE1|nr:uncharacterized protein HMPREF1541_08822 [Cyphellophora europaea CBS 101466]ETN36544.1 hypothetical protein HMPREF1541_08822 [Cyphellophora europaea CBS 101466]
MSTFTLLTAVLATLLPLSTSTPQHCKPMPNTPNWPSPTAWQTLNNTLNGHLLSPPPPGAVCHPTHPLYNNASCTALLTSWTSSDFHARNPITSDYNDDTCRPDPTRPCSRDGYPAYTVNATEAAHVAAAVRFARDTGVRFVVKGTGHDFPGRSAGRGALSVHTHWLRGVEVLHEDPRAAKYGGVAAVKIGAGMRWGEVYAAVAKENVTVVGGADLNVGVGGWTGGGGHSPVSSMYGLGADNVLEMEVVTADGEVRTINEECEPDLFWAMRGGGPGTYAVMLSVTMRAHPATMLSTYAFSYSTTALSAAFWNMTAYFHTQIPRIADAGAMGYYFTVPNITALGADASAFPGNIDATTVDASQAGLLAGLLLFPSTANATEIMTPLETALAALEQPHPIHTSHTATPPTDFWTIWSQTQPQSVGSTNTRLGSWLLGAEGITSKPVPELAATLAAASGGLPLPQLGHMVAGPGVRNAPKRLPGGGDAVLPAWRDAYTHVVLPAGWAGAEDEEAATAALRRRVGALKSLQPGSGAYYNEADPTNEAWKRDYYGENYGRLAAVKGRWDPEGVFWCKACVGSDEWVVSGGEGVGQEAERLCRKA